MSALPHGAVPARTPAPDLEPASWSPLDAIESSLGILPARQQVQAPRWLAPLAISALVGMIPWLIYLGCTLPSKVHTDNYDIAWVGFDTGLMLVLGVLGFAAWRRSAATGALAAVAAMMLVIDAWFDITTSAESDMWLAVVLAAFGELPLAAICGWAAYAAERHRARTYQRICQRWQHAMDAAREAAAEGGEAALRVVSRPPAVPPSR